MVPWVFSSSHFRSASFASFWPKLCNLHQIKIPFYYMPTMFMVWEKLQFYYLKKPYTCLTSSLTMSSLSGSIYRRDASCSPTLGSNSWQSLLIWNNTIAKYVKQSPHLHHHRCPNLKFFNISRFKDIKLWQHVEK